MEAEVSIAAYYHRKADVAEAKYAILVYVPTSL
jgi:hypothetical protein